MDSLVQRLCDPILYADEILILNVDQVLRIACHQYR
jgi:hypothetical protein